MRTIDCSRVTNRRAYKSQIEGQSRARKINLTTIKIYTRRSSIRRISMANKERTSLVNVAANARVRPASDAVIWGDSTETRAVRPMTADDSRLNRTESHRFTESRNDEPL